MIIAGTGHRNLNNAKRVMGFVEKKFEYFEPNVFISGMALGFDLYAADVALFHDIDVWAYIPWKGHVDISNPAYKRVLESATEVRYISDEEKFPGNYIYQRRNEAMVDDCDLLVGAWNGKPSGTKNCLDYAEQVGRGFIVVNPDTGKETLG